MSEIDYNPKTRFLLFDGHALIYRAYYAFPGLTDPEGRLVNAVYGFSRILLTALQNFEPEYIAVAFDHKAPTNRSKEYEEYKAHRAPMPDDLQPQIEIIKEVVDALNIPRFEVPGYEADDLIGAIVSQLESHKLIKKHELLITVITGDKDLLQLVNDDVRVFIPGRSKKNGDAEYDAKRVQEKMGVTPEQIPDMKALMGDASDNIPGVKGIGPKTAVQLLQAYTTLEGVYDAVAQLTTTKSFKKEDTSASVFTAAVLKKLIADKDNAYLSQRLAQILRLAPITFDLEKCRVSDYHKDKVSELFDQLGFRSLVPLLPKDDFEQGVQNALF